MYHQQEPTHREQHIDNGDIACLSGVLVVSVWLGCGLRVKPHLEFINVAVFFVCTRPWR